MARISVITINFNNKEGLQKTMASVFAQNFTDVEYIVIDGGSTDGSRECIEQQAEKLFYWVSEKDKGVYNAMNKGIAKATGEYTIFLNSGDFFKQEDSLELLIEKSKGEDIVFGDLLFVKDDGSSRECIFPQKLSFSFMTEGFNSLPHASTLIRRSLFEKIGLYTEHYKIVSDWEFFLLAINRYNCSYVHVPALITTFNLEGISAMDKNNSLIEAERLDVLQKHFPTFIDDYEEMRKTKTELAAVKKLFGYKLQRKVAKLLTGFSKPRQNSI
jgi:glycosyltransferase involved in cell wall biosynthesis